ncbi:MAG: hypothetical protein DRN81_03705 [Thermoproteota archaeon]|nr:MAG: hypothetical protein DRN81_03705 [Candidatus Korarchaeota archaeon]
MQRIEDYLEFERTAKLKLYEEETAAIRLLCVDDNGWMFTTTVPKWKLMKTKLTRRYKIPATRNKYRLCDGRTVEIVIMKERPARYSDWKPEKVGKEILKRAVALKEKTKYSLGSCIEKVIKRMNCKERQKLSVMIEDSTRRFKEILRSRGYVEGQVLEPEISYAPVAQV